jgi:mannose-6-phosphate isomerase-like protein (cupin superfamily)
MTEEAETVVPCSDLDATLASYVERGFRLDMIMPADAPRIAVVSGHGKRFRLVAEQAAPPAGSDSEAAFLTTRATAQSWVPGRAGMQYRDLIPGRLGGRFIASHIRIPGGGPVADYVHHHKVRFQMIYCRRGWVRVVYEDQGSSFVMHAGDCVLQPPHIRHRVLESSPGLEVIEIASPAEHETHRDHDLELPTANPNAHRTFAGQRFVRHIAAEANWRHGEDGVDYRDTGIGEATGGLAGVRVLRITPERSSAPRARSGEFLLLAILEGRVQLQSRAQGVHTLEPDDACCVPAGADYVLNALTPSQILEVTQPAHGCGQSETPVP